MQQLVAGAGNNWLRPLLALGVGLGIRVVSNQVSLCLNVLELRLPGYVHLVLSRHHLR